jgi:hypothetical protein
MQIVLQQNPETWCSSLNGASRMRRSAAADCQPATCEIVLL